MPSLSTFLPVLEDALFAMIWTTYSSRVPTQQWTGRTNRHHEALSLYVKALSKGRYGSSLLGMDGCSDDSSLGDTPGSVHTSP
eukprot:298544-Pelagomonas_calceolata.AAC.1